MAGIDKIIHERVRLLILTYVAGHDHNSVSFNELQRTLELTPGNLSVQLKKLKNAGYINIEKAFRDNKPYTTVGITLTGSDALNDYVNEMERIIKVLKS
ncbi:MAG: transcriptional regulator [Desulfobacteraceae bacterium]|nr:transcriptional regulator [Desulfobacteraceae bacterium]